MQTAREFFVHGLTDILDAENQLVEALKQQEEESSREELKKAFAGHRAQTERQVERLEQIFEALDEEPEETECKGVKGLIEEHDEFMEEEDPSEELIDVFNVGAGIKVERYEISEYEGLIRLAVQLGETKAEKLLNQNLKEEQATLKKLEGFSKRLKLSEAGSEEEEGEDEGRKPAESSGGSRKRGAA